MKRLACGLALALCACPSRPSMVALSADLEALAPHDDAATAAHFTQLLTDNLEADPYRCMPPADVVLRRPDAPRLERRIRGRLPHYGFYHGDMLYRVGVRRGSWLVSLNVALEPSSIDVDDVVELPDCALRPELRGDIVCQGKAYEDDPGVEACPGSGRFEAPASRHNLRALAARWSREVEGYWNRDAEDLGLPVRYDFTFALHDEPLPFPVDVRMPLYLSCGRTPYFMAFRSGWSIPIVAHEVGHFLGLLDEYEALSGVFSFYPKTPFTGSEDNRMGLSMKKHTRFMPLHHYLVLRRYHCDEPSVRDPYRGLP